MVMEVGIGSGKRLIEAAKNVAMLLNSSL